MLEVARRHPLVDPDRLIVTGISQGGGITLAAAGLAPMAGISLRGVAPDVPFLCHFRRATEITDANPYAELTAFVAGWRDLEEVAYHTLGYFDGVHLGRRASAPALFSVALMDDVCPPSTVFAAFNAYGEGAGVAKDIEIYTHNRHEGGVDYQVDRQLRWFANCFAD
jgi:cephalosporin-C deacetylase